jgi:hypothetical protein
VLLAEELTLCDGPPVRLRILGEDLVAFRDTQGKVGRVDRREEHLGTTDAAVITARRRLLKMARDLQNGIEPEAVLRPVSYNLRAVDQVSDEADFARFMDLYADAALGQV